MKKISLEQEIILEYLISKNGYYISPTEIGINVGGKEYISSSSWASPKLLSLVKHGLAERNEKGHYIAKLQ